MAVLLIGSTGNGKSTFGNYLVDPSEQHLFGDQIFKTAKNNLPETQNVKEYEIVLKRSECDQLRLTVIDTPGLNEDAERDLHHMMQIVEQLKNVEAVRACVLVVKFNSKIDSQYKATIQYYKKLLPSLFEKNVVVVVTDLPTDSRSEALRKRQGIIVDNVLGNIRKEIVKNGELTYDPMIFTIDCLPVDAEEQATSMQTREAFIQFIAQMEPFTETTFKVAKTPYVVKKDDETAKKYEGEIAGYNGRLKEANELAKECLEMKERKGQQITEEEKQITKLQSEVDEKDTAEHVTAKSFNLEMKWKLFRTQESAYDVESEWRIVNVKKWTNGHCYWLDEIANDRRVKGKVRGKFMRGLYANMTLETEKRLKYASNIRTLRQELREARIHREKLEREQKRIEAEHEQYKEEFALLEKFIKQRRKNITELADPYMTMSEATIHLVELQKKKREMASN